MGDRLRSAAEPVGEGGLQYHLRVKPGDVARYVLLPGDPGRTGLIAGMWDEHRLVADHREYRTYTGTYRGVGISVTSTGIGSPSTAIAIEELLRVGADTFIRVGTMGSIQSTVRPGDLVIGLAAVRMEGTSKQYAPEGFPAVASPDVVMALVEAAEGLGYRYHVGLVASTDSFYVGQGRPGFRGFITPRHSTIIPELSALGVLGFEMESSTIFTLATIYGARAGCVCAVVANRVTDEFIVDAGVREASRVASEAVRILAAWDREAGGKGKRWIYPGLVSGIYR
ncbi:MAG: uridine phosphorylase [Desulfurococcales archaeon]|nr:uridine phosphorylase [Desulfurococcales archaeon]MCE4604946.1 uridine phosphorylase [Desulfurococcales archaeon]